MDKEICEISWKDKPTPACYLPLKDKPTPASYVPLKDKPNPASYVPLDSLCNNSFIIVYTSCRKTSVLQNLKQAENIQTTTSTWRTKIESYYLFGSHKFFFIFQKGINLLVENLSR